MKLHKLAKELNIGTKKISEYCNSVGIIPSNPFQELNDEEISKIKLLHSNVDSAYESSLKLPVTNSHELEFTYPNPFAIPTIELIQSNNLFLNREPKFLEYINKQIPTIFSDYEACLICDGLTDTHLQFLARKYYNNQASKYEIIVLHQYANEAFDKYGGEMLSWVLSLPKLPFKAINATSIFSEFDKRKITSQFPVLRIFIKNLNNEKEKLQISFFIEQTMYGNIRNDNIIQVKSQTSGKLLMRISRSGFIIPESNAKHIFPILQVFIRFSQDTQKMIINYGLETGECRACGRDLTNKESIKRGMGPICWRDGR